MDYKKLLRRERILWHNHFIPSFLAGLAAALISLLYQMTIANVVLFSSVGASAAILTNNRSHHLTKLHTTIVAYVIAVVISSSVYLLDKEIPIHISVKIFLLVFLVALFQFLLNAFHPPAISGSLAFILLDRSIIDLLYLLSEITILLIFVRFTSYLISQHLTISEFVKEFEKSF